MLFSDSYNNKNFPYKFYSFHFLSYSKGTLKLKYRIEGNLFDAKQVKARTPILKRLTCNIYR